MSKRYLISAVCDVCGKEYTGNYLPEEWVDSPVGEDVTFCCKDCMKLAYDRIMNTYNQVFGRYLTDKEVAKLANAVKPEVTK
jgi:hypothetical protein